MLQIAVMIYGNSEMAQQNDQSSRTFQPWQTGGVGAGEMAHDRCLSRRRSTLACCFCRTPLVATQCCNPSGEKRRSKMSLLFGDCNTEIELAGVCERARAIVESSAPDVTHLLFGEQTRGGGGQIGRERA